MLRQKTTQPTLIAQFSNTFYLFYSKTINKNIKTPVIFIIIVVFNNLAVHDYF